jgi:hypothetical protein
MNRPEAPNRLSGLLLMLAAALSFYLALHMGDGLRLAMMAKGMVLMSGAVLLFRRDAPLPLRVPARRR